MGKIVRLRNFKEFETRQKMDKATQYRIPAELVREMCESLEEEPETVAFMLYAE